MFQAFSKLSVKIDKSDQIFEALNKLCNKEVLVGIPEENSSREEESITNAELAYIHTHGIRQEFMRKEMDAAITNGTSYSKAYKMYLQSHGSPLWHSPPRPIIEPAIESKKEPIAEEFKQVIVDVSEGKSPDGHLNRAGMIGQNAARGWFTNSENGWAPNSPETIKKKGSDRPLIDKGDLRKSIIYVVREK